jgi:hypothetical protein
LLDPNTAYLKLVSETDIMRDMAEFTIALCKIIEEDGCPCGGRWIKGIFTDQYGDWYALKCETCGFVLPMIKAGVKNE